MVDTEDSTEEELENDSLLEIQKINAVAINIITMVRRLMQHRLELDDSTNVSTDFEVGTEHSLDWEDFNNTFNVMEEIELIYREHLLGFVDNYDNNDDFCSIYGLKMSLLDIQYRYTPYKNIHHCCN